MKKYRILSLFLIISLFAGITGCKKVEEIHNKNWVYYTEYEDYEVQVEKEIEVSSKNESSSDTEFNKNEGISSGTESEKKEERIFYVSSSEGSDWNDGLSPEEPLKSLAVACTTASKKGDKLLLKCGDVWRGESIDTAVGVTVSSYGKGEKPLLIGSPRNYSGEGLWKLTDKENIWVCTEKITSDIGTIVFDEGKATAIKKMKSVDELKNDLDFYHDWKEYKVYLYSEKDPTERYKSIEFNWYMNLINIKSGVTIENIEMRYADYGIVGSSLKDVIVRNCEFYYLGGCRHSNIEETRFGNAIEFWGSCSNALVENNFISQMYDTGFTVQYASARTSDIIVKDVTVKNNTIEYCHWSMEYYITGSDSSGYKGYITNLNIEGNTFAYSGEGWSAAQRSTTGASHFQTFTWADFSKSNITIKNNIFKGAADTMLYIGWKDYTPEFSGNHFTKYEGNTFIQLGSKLYAFTKNTEKFIKELDPKAKIQYLKK